MSKEHYRQVSWVALLVSVVFLFFGIYKYSNEALDSALWAVLVSILFTQMEKNT